MPRPSLFLLAILALLASSPARASERPEGLTALGAIPVQDGGRVMPLESYARRLAVQLTGRTTWSASRGPEGFAGRDPMQLLCDLMFDGQAMLHKKLIAIEDKPFKRLVGLDPERRFFSAVELSSCAGLSEQLEAFGQARQSDPQAQTTRPQRKALDIRDAVERAASLASGEPIPVIPAGPGLAFVRAGPQAAEPGAESVRDAWATLAIAYKAGGPIHVQVGALRAAISARGQLQSDQARAINLEVFYDNHQPWRWTAVFYGLAIVTFGLSRLALRGPLVGLAVLFAAAGVAEHALAVGLRVAILGRAPVSNTYESLLWMGLVGIALGSIAQALNRRGWYLFAGLCAAFISVIFAGMVPLSDQTNALPAVLRSNFWLTIHVLTIVASYGVLAVASVLGHVYLTKEVLFARRCDLPPADARRSDALIVQNYRTIQVGLILLTTGTILGGVWASESWGRFWGWDPKETWALISIITYFAVLHARYIRWLKDFGLAAASILGFVVIVWTFYGVNYVMATGLHSYGFGSGGEVWVALWAALEIAFLVACRVRHAALQPPSPGTSAVHPAPSAARPSIQG